MINQKLFVFVFIIDKLIAVTSSTIDLTQSMNEESVLSANTSITIKRNGSANKSQKLPPGIEPITGYDRTAATGWL
jgi:hypothetical protein